MKKNRVRKIIPSKKISVLVLLATIFISQFGFCPLSGGSNFSNEEKPIHVIRVGQVPGDIAVSYTHDLAFVLNTGASSVSVIDLSKNRVAKTIPVGILPIHESLNANGTRLYVADQENHLVTISVSLLRIVRDFEVSSLPQIQAFAIDHSDKDAYVIGGTGDRATVVKLNVKSGKVEGRVVIANEAPNTSPCETVLSPNGKYLMVSNCGGDSISDIDANTLKILGVIAIGKDPGAIAFDATGNFAYAVHAFPYTLVTISVARRVVVRTTKLQSNVNAMVFDEKNHLLFLAQGALTRGFLSQISIFNYKSNVISRLKNGAVGIGLVPARRLILVSNDTSTVDEIHVSG